MGLLGGLFGPKYPELAGDSEAAAAIASHGDAFSSFVAKANDTIEAVPGEGALYAFVGKPPKAFGIVWFENGTQLDVRSLMEAGRMTREAAVKLVGDLGELYASHSDVERFAHKVGGHNVTVTPSSRLHDGVKAAIQRAMS